MLSYKLSRSVRLALWIGTTATLSSALCSTAFAADATADKNAMDEVVVTGSRIAVTEYTSPTPVQILTGDDLVSGSVNASDILRQLPIVGISGFSSANSNFATSGAGVNTINLRNLGDSRTLVLVNGRRFVPGIAGDSAVDFNMIPTDFIERIEVITGGASAIYGSDAIAGVVNVILKKDFEGVAIHGQAGGATEGGSNRRLGSITIGSGLADGKGHVMFNISHDQDTGLYSRQRKISEQDLFTDDTDPSGYSPVRSSYAPQGWFFVGDNDYTFDRSNNLITNNFDIIENGFNRNGVRRITTPTTRSLFSGILNYDISDHHHLITEFTYGQTDTSSELEPFPLADSDVYPDGSGMPITNAYIPQAVADYINTINTDGDPDNDITGIGFRKRLSDVANRGSQARRSTVRAVIGLQGDLFRDWTYEASFVYGRTKESQVSSGQVNVQSLRYALDSVHSDPNDPTSPIVCRDSVAQAFGCVPVDFFGFNSISAAAANYITAPQTRDVTIGERVLSASVSGSIVALPAGDWKLAAGLEYRKESSEELWDALTNQGLNAGNVLPNVYGEFDTKEGFVETVVPLVSNAPFAKTLSANAAIRFADYSTVGSTNAWKAGLDWAPDSNVLVRGMYATAIRAPNIGELYGGRAQTFPTGLIDPCDNVTATSTGPDDATCRAIPGVSQSITNGGFSYSLADYQGITGYDGSNPSLGSETAKTLTLGTVITPTAIPKLAITLDWFDIKIDKAVGSIARQTSIDQCLATGNPAFCSNVTRSAATGKILAVDATLVNVATMHTSGIDMTVRYGWEFGASGSLDTSLSWTHLTKLDKVDFEGAPLFDNLGLLNGDGRLGAGFKDKGILSLTYDLNNFSATWRINYLGSIHDSAPGDVPDAINSVSAYTYHNVQLKYTFKPSAYKFQTEFYVGADNLLDKKPPSLVSGTASDITGAETAADTYDAIGRFVYAGFGIKF